MTIEEARIRDAEARKRGPQWLLDERADNAQWEIAFPPLLDLFEKVTDGLFR